MISLSDYFGKYAAHPDATQECYTNAEQLLDAVDGLERAAAEEFVDLPINPVTKTRVSGAHNGGFRPHDCPEGSRLSSHKEGRGIDLYDPENALDDWLTDDILEQHGLYREHPTKTEFWCHLTTRAPHSGTRSFFP